MSTATELVPPEAPAAEAPAVRVDQAPEHRNDIDGLRAVAVLSVLFFHLQFSGRLSGGFVGVDVFFVISGFLITGIVQKELDAKTFSIVGFYNRRVRRIFPAVFVVYAFCLIAAGALLFPSEVKTVGREVLSSIAFASNVLFAGAAGYFNETSRESPLLHTWSLSVEEQFYLGLPLLLLLLARAPKWARLAVLGAIALGSFAYCAWVVRLDQRRAFYFVHFRAWELLLGALLALRVLPALRWRWLSELLGVVGLGLIVFAVLAVDETKPFPGFWALPPCLGALLILYSGGEVRTVTARVLGTPPLRFIGLISYSLYLWHWPLIVFCERHFGDLTWPHRWAILGLSLLAATLSYRFVETPFRRKPYALTPPRTLVAGGVGMVVLAGLALVAAPVTAKLRPRAALADSALRYLFHEDVEARSGVCFLNSGAGDFALFKQDVCLKLDPDRKNVLIMGDSHSANFTPAFAALHPELNVLQASASGCAPTRHTTGPTHCRSLSSFIYNEFLVGNSSAEVKVDTIILAGHWPAGSEKRLLDSLAYIKRLGFRAVVLGPVVQYRRPLPQLLAQSILNDDPGLLDREREPRPRQTDARLAYKVTKAGFEYFSVYDATCPKGVCDLWAAPDVPMQIDRVHLSRPGAELVLKRLGVTATDDPVPTKSRARRKRVRRK